MITDVAGVFFSVVRVAGPVLVLLFVVGLLAAAVSILIEMISERRNR